MRIQGISILIACLALIPTGAVASRQSAGYTAPKQLVLRPSDMPAGFKRTAATVETNAAAAKVDHIPLSTLVRHGRIVGFDTAFKKSAAVGLIEIQNTVLAYKTAAGARWQMQYSKAQTTKTIKGHTFQQISVGSIGSEAVGFSFSEKEKTVRLTDDFVLVRRGRYVSLVQGLGLTGTFEPTVIVALAKKVDARMKRAK